MSELALFALVFGGLLLLRFALLTAVFLWILPEGDRCPNCDAHTLWVRAPVRNRILPWLRTSWCPACGWEGTLRHERGSPGSAPSRAASEHPAGRRDW